MAPKCVMDDGCYRADDDPSKKFFFSLAALCCSFAKAIGSRHKTSGLTNIILKLTFGCGGFIFLTINLSERVMEKRIDSSVITLVELHGVSGENQ